MSDSLEIVRGIVYLILTLAGIAGIVIVVLAILLHKARAEIAELQGLAAQLRARIKVLQERSRVEGLGDAELADDLGASLRNRGSGVRGRPVG